MYSYQQSGAGGYPYQGYPPQQGLYQGYPPAGAGAYPPQPQQGLYPPMQGAGGYQPNGSMVSSPSTYAPTPSYAGSAYPPQSSAYPPAGGYPPQGSPYPPKGSAYPPAGGYPPQGSPYPPKGSAYPPASGYPPQSSPYPPQGSAYPPQGSAYPPAGGFPPQGSYASYTSYATGAYNQTNTNFGLGGTTRLLTPDEISNACKKLRDAMKGFGTDENALISVLGKYPPIQMNQISAGYKAHYGKTLESAVDSETSGNFGKLCIALSKSILDFDIYCLHEAIAGLGTDEDCLIEILVGRTNADIQAINRAYKEKYHNSLEKDIKGDTSGYFERLLVALVQGNRDETNSNFDVKSDVEALYRAGKGRMGTDESAIISLLCNRSDAHLRQVFGKYQQKYGHSVEKAIKDEFSGDIKKALVNLVKAITNRNEYIAEQFENSMKGFGTKDGKLIRLTVRYRDPEIIKPIKEAYKTMFGKSLKKRIEGDTSGDYKKLLLTCIGEK